MTLATGKQSASNKSRAPSVLTEAGLDCAIKEIDSLLDQGGALSASDETYLEALSESVRNYEALYHPIPEPSQADLFRLLLDARGINVPRLAKDTGIPRAAMEAIVKGERPASSRQANLLGHYFRVDSYLFKKAVAPAKEFVVSCEWEIRAGTAGSGTQGRFAMTTNSVSKSVEFALEVIRSLSPPGVRQKARPAPSESKYEEACV